MTKTLFIDCSPKRRLSASGFIIDLTSLFVTGEKDKESIRTKADYQKVLDKLEDANNLVFAIPLYVDGVPSHILPFLKKMEGFCRENELKINVYVIANNGFIEGRQNEPLMQIMENFCIRSNIKWCGGLGIGGGVMMNVMRIMTAIFFIITILNLIYCGISFVNSFQKDIIINFIKQILILMILSSGIIFLDIKLALCINKQKNFGKHYTRIMLPSFVFIICADIYFTIISIFHGGIFRSLLSKEIKNPFYF